MLSMYAAYFLTVVGVDPYIGIAIVLPLFFLVGVIVYRLVIDPIINATSLMQIFVTVGLSIMLQNLALYFFDGDMRSTTTHLITGKTEFIGLMFNNQKPVCVWYYISCCSAAFPVP